MSSHFNRQLILMRHAKQSGDGPSDHERPLTTEGAAQAHRVGVRLHTEGPIPEAVLSSTALRCQETWHAVEKGLGVTVPTSFESTLYNSSSATLLDGLAGVDESIQTLLLLAHNPGISLLALQLGGSRQQDVDMLREGFTPATTATFEIRGPWSTVSPRTASLLHFDRASSPFT